MLLHAAWSLGPWRVHSERGLTHQPASRHGARRAGRPRGAAAGDMPAKGSAGAQELGGPPARPGARRTVTSRQPLKGTYSLPVTPRTLGWPHRAQAARSQPSAVRAERPRGTTQPGRWPPLCPALEHMVLALTDTGVQTWLTEALAPAWTCPCVRPGVCLAPSSPTG